jgi:hypothetical protein
MILLNMSRSHRIVQICGLVGDVGCAYFYKKDGANCESNNNLKMAEKKSKLADNKIKPSAASVEEFINNIQDEQKRKDSFVLLEMMKKASKEDPVLWNTSFIGFGMKRHKSSTTGRESDWMRIGFAARKAKLTLYFGTLVDAHAAALEKLGKHKAAMGCLYINKLADIDLKVLKSMIEAGLKAK